MEYGFLSVVPPLVTIVLALVLKNVFVSLLVGIFLSALILCGGNLFVGLNNTFYSIVGTFESSGNTIVLMSMLLIGALIYLIERSGGIEGFVDVMVKKRGIIKSKRASAFFTWLLGIVVFTSGSLSCMVTGSVSRPLNDSMKLPHEKAAFLVHTTSTPVCVLLPLSGWGASMIGYLTSGGVSESQAATILVQSIPLNFYCMLAVLGTLVLCLLRKDFGPMKAAELRADTTGELDAPSSARVDTVEDDKSYLDTDRPLARNMIIPIVVLILGVLVVLTVTGSGNPLNGDGMNALLWGVFLALVASGVLCITQKIYSLSQYIEVAFKGAGGMLSISMILVFGFTMGTVVSQLGTGLYLCSIFEKFLSPALLPALVFLMACLISFATGTSMGTMAITSVICLPMAIQLGVSIPLVAGAVWAGSIFGDHCSPISDTTIMTCSTTGCNIIDHVKTQFPYCLAFAALSLIFYLIFGFLM